jgi:hypothetical protein
MAMRWTDRRAWLMGLVVAALVILVAAVSLWPRHEWQVRSFSLGHEALERTVFELELQLGTKLAYRLDPKPGAEATLVLHTPSGDEIVWDRGWQRTLDEAEFTVVEAGVHRLMLATAPAATPPGETTPEDEVRERDSVVVSVHYRGRPRSMIIGSLALRALTVVALDGFIWGYGFRGARAQSDQPFDPIIQAFTLWRPTSVQGLTAGAVESSIDVDGGP